MNGVDQTAHTSEVAPWVRRGLILAGSLLLAYFIVKLVLFKLPIITRYGIDSEEYWRYAMYSNIGWGIVIVLTVGILFIAAWLDHRAKRRTAMDTMR